MKSPRLVLIGLDAVDGGLVRRWAGEGHLPTLAKLLASGAVAPIVTPIAQHEAAHVNLITETLGKIGEQALAKPTFKFTNGTFSASTNFLKAAKIFEDAGVKAYQGQVTNVKDKTLLAAAAAIAGTESRHAAVIGYLLDKRTVPGATEPQGTEDEVLAIVQPYLKVAGS